MGFGPSLEHAQVAQLVEHATENRSVGGSIPPLGTIPLSTGNTSLAPALTNRLAQQTVPEPDRARPLLALCLLSQDQSLALEERPFQVEASDARHVPFWCCRRTPARCVGCRFVVARSAHQHRHSRGRGESRGV